jgi:hypothetical protein
MLSRDAQRTEAADIAQQETIFTLYEYFQDTVQLGLPQSIANSNSDVACTTET